MPICVAGMHRSGTSMVTRLLNLCGLQLGPTACFSPPSASNSEGHWEHTGFLSLNDALLSSQHAGWNLPPSQTPKWSSPELEPLRKQALKLASGFEGMEPWGWKDPRNCLTIGFWMSVFDELRIIIPIRSPLEIADSLHARNGYSRKWSLLLWIEYHRSLLSASNQGNRLIVHYDSFFRDPQQQLWRMLPFADMPAPPRIVSEASATVRSPLRHSVRDPREFSDPDLPPGLLDLYQSLCNECGHEPVTNPDQEEIGSSSPVRPRATSPKPNRLPAFVNKLLPFGLDWIPAAQSTAKAELEHQLRCRLSWEADLRSSAETLPKR